MELYSTLGSISTVLSFLVFIGIVFWAYSARRKRSFDEAANEPFVLPDELQHDFRKTLTPSPLPVGRGELGARLQRDTSDGAGARR